MRSGSWGLPSLRIPPNHTGRQMPTMYFRGPSENLQSPSCFSAHTPRPKTQVPAPLRSPSQPATTAQAPRAWRRRGRTGGGAKARPGQAAWRLVLSGPPGHGITAGACAEWLSAAVTERRGVGERDLARPAGPAPAPWSTAPPPRGVPGRSYSQRRPRAARGRREYSRGQPLRRSPRGRNGAGRPGCGKGTGWGG